MTRRPLENPFRPGAGHMPPYLAGRDEETDEFRNLLKQDAILENMILTGLRGVGKTVLLDTFKPIARNHGWLWIGTELSESASVSEETLAIRLLTDLSVATSGLVFSRREISQIGYNNPSATEETTLTFDTLRLVFTQTPGLVADKLKAVLLLAWEAMRKQDVRGVVFAYDEAQTMSDKPDREQYPLAMLLDVFQSVQRAHVPFLLALAGLPTLFPKLVEARTFAERMFHIIVLERLADPASRDAICRPIEEAGSPITLGEPASSIGLQID